MGWRGWCPDFAAVPDDRACGVTGRVAFLAFAVFLAVGLALPPARMQDGLKLLSEGNFDIRIDGADRSDEIVGRLAETGRGSEISGKIREAVEEEATATHVISSNALTARSSSSQVASNVNTLSDFMETSRSATDEMTGAAPVPGQLCSNLQDQVRQILESVLAA